jgi:hypothetical protein
LIFFGGFLKEVAFSFSFFDKENVSLKRPTSQTFLSFLLAGNNVHHITYQKHLLIARFT